MANTFTKTTKASLSTADVTSNAATNIVTVGSTATLIVLGVLISNKTGSSANANVYLLPSSGDAVFLVKNAPVPAGSTLEIISGNKFIVSSSDVIRASSDTASALDLTISYLQQT
jgi:hypothetical protein